MGQKSVVTGIFRIVEGKLERRMIVMSADLLEGLFQAVGKATYVGTANALVTAAEHLGDGSHRTISYMLLYKICTSFWRKYHTTL